MEDPHDQDPNNLNQQEMRNEPVRSRWTPKPEQILILESIFNSGMVNPPKDETVRIRKLLEKFGAVGDANVFYWFQNRRSRSRRRQRQMQQAAAAAAEQRSQASGGGGGSAIQYENSNNYMGFGATSSSNSFASSYASCYNNSNSSYGQSSSSCGFMCQEGFDGFYGNNNSMSSSQVGFGDADHQHHHQSSILCASDTSNNVAYESGFITVFLNGVPTEVPRGPFDMKALFGQDVLLVHSSGVPLPTNEFGFLMQSLDHGESYFLVSKHT